MYSMLQIIVLDVVSEPARNRSMIIRNTFPSAINVEVISFTGLGHAKRDLRTFHIV